jgi:predicted phosphoribosyltransferase/pimeloyl-ACP methyl ester carboxylesterase
MSDLHFRDRSDAGKALARALQVHQDQHPVILGLPRGGVPVAWEIAHSLDADMDVLIVRKLGLPMQPEYAFGAVGEGDVTVLDSSMCASAGMSETDVARVVQRERNEVVDRVAEFRGGQPMMNVAGREVIIVDDGIATGSTMLVAIEVVRRLGARRIYAAAPVASRSTAQLIAQHVDGLICLSTPENFYAVGAHYQDFTQVSDEQVHALLSGYGLIQVEVPFTDALGRSMHLQGSLVLPAGAPGIVIFAHGSGSSRFSSRNVHVARVLQRSGVGTFLFDLLTESEAADRNNVFNIDLLATRVESALDHLARVSAWAEKPIGLFGASTGAAAALVAAARRTDQVQAVVSRGGRPDLAGAFLSLVQAPTLLIVGGLDREVIALNEFAMRHLHCAHELKIVPGAGHLFEEPGTLDHAASLAAEWFRANLGGHSFAVSDGMGPSIASHG